MVKKRSSSKKSNKRTRKRKQINSESVVIAILLIILIFLIIILTVSRVNSEVRSKDYVDDMIRVDNRVDYLDIKANIIQDSGSLVMLISSDASKLSMVTVNAQFLNDKDEVISDDQGSTFVMGNGQVIMNIILPNLDDDDYAGDVLLEITAEDSGSDDFVDVSKITYEETHDVLEDNTISFQITGTNNSDSLISYLEGSVVALKDDNIVAFNNFNLQDIDANATFSTTVGLPGVLFDDIIVPVEYDDILIFTSSATTLK